MSEAPRRIITVELISDSDVVLARNRAREISMLLGFSAQDGTRIATATSEIARNAYRYASAGRVTFAVDDAQLLITVSDKGVGIPHLDEVFQGTYVSSTGLGMGIVGAKRLVDALRIDTGPAGTTVVLSKHLPAGAGGGAEAIARISSRLSVGGTVNAVEEIQLQNRELVQTLDELRERSSEIERLNQELADTNRGVLALYAELDDKAESLRRASELKSRFLSNMTHEFRTPLNSILSITGLLLMQADGPLTPEQQRQMEYVRTSARSLMEMVNDLLDIAKIEAGKTDIHVNEFRLDEFFTAIRGMFRPLLSGDAVSLEIDVPQPLTVRTDEAKLSQIVRNFVSNAIKYTNAGSVKVSSRIADNHLSIVVTDSGIGIPPQYLDSIFEEFVQVENPLQKKAKGTGLGLPLSRRLAQLLGGDVSVESRLGEGSTFVVTIPVSARTGEAEPEREVTDATARVLIIDDDEMARYILRSLLPAGCDVREASDGPEGVMKAKQLLPDIVFVDVLMPTMNGIEVVKRLRNDPATARVPVVVRTSKTLTSEEHLALESEGVLSVLSKSGDSVEQSMADVRSIFVRANLVSA